MTSSVVPIGYKYSGQRGIDILRELQLKVTPPESFNDPFEFAPHVICSNPAREVRRHLKDKGTMREMYEFEKSNGKFLGNFKEFRKYFSKERPKMASLLAADYNQIPERLQSAFQWNISKSIGVLCMSMNRSSILMWGHYCEMHRGLVVGFDLTHPSLQRENGFKPVEYVRERPVYDTSWKRGAPHDEILRKMALQKNDEWQYEEELRQTFILNGLATRRLDNDETGYFLPFAAEAVKSVTLGTKASKEFAEKVRRELSKPEFGHVAFEQARLHKSEYRMEFFPLSKRV